MHMTLSILTFQKEKNSSFLKPVHQICTGTKNKSFELQSAPNLHRDKQSKKKHKNFRGIVAPPHLDCEVFVCFVFFCPCAGLVHIEVQNFCFFGPCAGLVHVEVQNLFFWSLCRFCALYSLNLLFVLCLWRFGMTHVLLSKRIISHGIGIACLNMMLFHCSCWFPDLVFLNNTTYTTLLVSDLGRELNLAKRHSVFKKEFLF